MKDIGKKRNGQFLQVIKEEGGIFPSLPLQPTDHIQGPLPFLPHLKIDFLQTGAVLDQDLPLYDHHPKVFL